MSKSLWFAIWMTGFVFIVGLFIGAFAFFGEIVRTYGYSKFWIVPIATILLFGAFFVSNLFLTYCSNKGMRNELL